MVLWDSQEVPRKAPPRFRQGSTKVPARVQQGSAKVLQVSWCLWFSGADPFWAAKFSVLKGSVEGSPSFHQGFTEVPPRCHQSCASFVISLVFWGRSVLGRQKVLCKVPPSLFKLVSQLSSSTLFCIFPQQR